LDTVSKGSKPVVYKSNMRLKFFSAAIEDSRITIPHIFTKITDDGVVVFGEYTIFLLFSYLDNQRHKAYITESQSVKFNETVSCHLPAAVDGSSFETQTMFDPQISCVRAASNAWSIEVKGEFDVFVYGDKEVDVTDSEGHGDSTTVVRLEGNNLTTNELLDMDTASIEKLLADNLTQPNSDTSDQ
jgi:hypothetical protein